MLLTTEQIDESKKEIERRMKNYPLIITKDDDDDVEDDDYRLSLFKRATDNEKNKAPIIKLLEKRSSKIKNLQEFWEKKIETEENQLALVALEILGVLVTSVMSERSFSKGRYVINEHRTNLSPENACNHFLVKCNRDIAIKCLDKFDIFEKSS